MEQKLSQIKVLHLEDQLSDAEQVARILTKAGLFVDIKVVDCRKSYEDALWGFEPDIIISDHNLPRFNSIEALNILHASQLEIPFILVTGTVSEEFAVEAMRTGADDYILKDRLHRLPIAVNAVIAKFDMAKEKRDAELRIKESEARYRSFFENSMDGILLTANGKIHAANPAAQAMFQMTESEICTALRADLTDVTDPRLLPLLTDLKLTGRAKGEINCIRKDGKRFPGEATSSVFTDAHGQETISLIIRDVTERKAAEEILIAKEQQLVILIENSPAALAMFDTDMRYIIASKQWSVDYKLVDQSIIGKSHYDVFQLMPAHWEDIHRRCLAGAIEKNDKEAFVAVDGTIDWLRWEIHPWYKPKNEVGGVIMITEVITDRVNAEEEKRQLTNRMLLATRSAAMGIWDWDIEENVLSWDEGMYRLYNLHDSQFDSVYEGWTDRIHAEDRNMVNEEIKQAVMQKKEYNTEFRIVWPDHSLHHIKATGLVERDAAGKPMRMIGMNWDITEKKVAAQELSRTAVELKNTLNDLQKIMDASQDIICSIDQEGRFAKVSAASQNILGFSPRELLGKRYIDLVWPEDVERTHQVATEIMNGTPVTLFENRYLHRNGSIVPILWSASWDDNDKMMYCIAKDVTERNKLDLEKQALIRRLQLTIKDLQQFSYIVSHNLRAPIAKILGLVSVIEPEGEENKFLLEKLSEEAANLDDVVKDINTIVSARRTEKAKMETVFFETELKLITKVLEFGILESSATITADFTEVKEMVTIKSYLYSILYNLVSNAIKYRVPDVAPHIEIKSTQENGTVCLSVKDNGMGIDLAKNGTKVFGLYKRFHLGSTPGKGIGLNLVKTHAETLGGRVDIESELNKGTQFRVYLPRNHAADMAETSA